MRLDKWLKVSRLIKRRTVANEACDNERISANGRVVKASYEVKVGDQLEIRFGARTVRLEVLSVTEPKGKENAVLLYKNFDFQRMGSCETRNPSGFFSCQRQKPRPGTWLQGGVVLWVGIIDPPRPSGLSRP